MNDRSIQLIEEAIQNLSATLNEQLGRLEEDLKSSSGDVHAKVAERLSFAKNLALGRKLTEIWEEVKFYPGLCKRDDWLIHRQCEIDYPYDDHREKEWDVSFLLNVSQYKFTYSYDGAKTRAGYYFHHPQLSLRDAANKVLIEIAIIPEDKLYRTFSVIAFIPGSWIQDFLECYERFQANKKERAIRQEYDPEKVAELKNKFGIE